MDRAQKGLLWNKANISLADITITHGLNILGNTYPWGAPTGQFAGKALISNMFVINKDNVMSLSPSGYGLGNAFKELTIGNLYLVNNFVYNDAGQYVLDAHWIGYASSSTGIIIAGIGESVVHPLTRGNYYSLIECRELKTGAYKEPISALPNGASNIKYAV